MAAPELNILFSSAGRRVELVRAFKRAHRDLGLEGKIVAIDCSALAPALQVADVSYIVPRIDSPEFVSTLVGICREEGIGIVFPLIDPEISVLSEARSQFERIGTRVATCSSDAVGTAADKWKTALFFEASGIASPRFWLPDDLDPATLDYPLLIKPRFGSAGQKVFKVEDPKALSFYLEVVPDPIVQEYLPGVETTSDIICGLDGRVMAVVSRERIEVRSGEVAKGVTVAKPEITDACLKIAARLPVTGPVNAQCIEQDGVHKFIEVNARLGGGVPLSIAAGADFPRWLLAESAGIDVEIPQIGSYETGMYFTRCDKSFYLSSNEYQSIAGRRI